RPPRHHVIEGHRDVGAEDPLDLGSALGGEGAAAAVYVTLKLHTVVVHPAEPLEREHLKATRIGEERTIPAHEAMQGPELLDDLLAGPHVQVVAIREHQRRADAAEVVRGERPDGPLSPDRHEHGRLDRAVGEGEGAGAGGAAGGVDDEFEHALLNAERGSRNAEQALVLPCRVPRSEFRVHMTTIASPYE